MNFKLTNSLGIFLVPVFIAIGCRQGGERSGDQSINSSATMASTNDTVRVNQPRAFNKGKAIAANGTNVQVLEASGASASGSDGALAAQLKTSLQGDATLGSLMQGVQVAAKDGKIILTGSVQNEAQKQSLGEKAREIAGEGKVENRLRVQDKTDASPKTDTKKQINP